MRVATRFQRVVRIVIGRDPIADLEQALDREQ